MLSVSLVIHITSGVLAGMSISKSIIQLYLPMRCSVTCYWSPAGCCTLVAKVFFSGMFFNNFSISNSVRLSYLFTNTVLNCIRIEGNLVVAIQPLSLKMAVL